MRISDWSSDVCSSDLLLQARRLAGEAVELAVAGKDARRPSDRQAAQEAAQKVMGVGRKGEARCIVEPPNAQTEMARDAALHRRHHLVKDKGPLAIGQPRSVLPAVALRLEGDAWPVVVAVDLKSVGAGKSVAVPGKSEGR